MLSYLQKFNNLDIELREKISSSSVMIAMQELEKKYGLNLATVVMRVMTKDISLLDLSKFFMFEYDMEARDAEGLVEEMKEKIFSCVADYLNFSLDTDAIDLEKISEMKEDQKKEAGLESWMQEQKKSLAVRASDFFFSPEDEEEVRELAKRLDGLNAKKEDPSVPIPPRADEIVNEAAKRINMNFSSDELVNRFKQILLTYIKGVRNKIDTKQALMKEVGSGGLDLNDELSSRIMSVADQVKDDFAKNPDLGKPAVPKEGQETPLVPVGQSTDQKPLSGQSIIDQISQKGARDTDYDFGALAARKNGQNSANGEIPSGSILAKTPKEAIMEKEGAVRAGAAIDPSMVQAGMSGQSAGRIDPPLQKAPETLSFDEVNRISGDNLPGNSEKQETSIVVDRLAGISESENILARVPSNSVSSAQYGDIPMTRVPEQSVPGGKVKMEDIKHVSRLVGPIDELRNMTLVDFRRLNPIALEAAGKIIEKIETLEKESYKKRLAGIQAWRESPVNRLYLAIGQKSIANGQGIDTTITRYQARAEETLTAGEFAAVMELNKRLRY